MPRPKGGYRLKNKKRVPGVTTITGRFKDSERLLFWACNQGKAIERGEISHLYDKRDEAANHGTQAHELVEMYINGELRVRDDEVLELYSDTEYSSEAVQGFRNYYDWEQNSRIKIFEQEVILVSEKYKFGGCPDAIGEDFQGRRILLDWKTSNGVYPDYIIQLAAYGQLWNENHPDNPITGGFHLCRFSKEYGDFAHHYWSELDDAWEQFKLFRQAYEIDKKLKKRI